MTYRAELAVVNLRVGRYEEALNVLKTALEKDPNYAEAYRLMGIAQLQMKKDKEACASFAKAKELGATEGDSEFYMPLSGQSNAKTADFVTFVTPEQSRSFSQPAKTASASSRANVRRIICTYGV